MARLDLRAGVALLGGLLAAGCDDGGPIVAPVPLPPDAGCVIDEAARTFEVYFVIDVSNSMVPFLTDLATELAAFTRSFPEENARGDRVLSSYFVVAFVNDVKLFPPEAERMTSHIAVGDAIRTAIAEAEGNRNLNSNTPNADPDENLLDALGAVIDRAPDPDFLLVLVATDQGFREAPAMLSGDITVTRTYAEVRSGLEALGARVHAFVPDQLDGLTRDYRGEPPLTDLNGGRVFDLRDLAAARESIRATLEDIALDAACNPMGSADAGAS